MVAERFLIDRSSLTADKVGIFRTGRYWQPDLTLVKVAGRLLLVKDYKFRPIVYRYGLGLTAIWREIKNYRRLAGIPGIPMFGGRIDRYALAVEFIPGRNAERLKAGTLSPDFFKRLGQIIESVHARGVVLGDLRNSKNILVSEDGSPYLIDFSTAFSRGPWWNPLQRWLYRIFEQDDWLGVAKLKRRSAPELLTDAERRALEEGLPLERVVHRIRDAIKKVNKRLWGPGVR